MIDINSEILTAFDFYTNGAYDKAENIASILLNVYPNHSDSLHLMGVIAYQRQQFEKAETYIKKSIDAYQKNTFSHYNLGLVYEKIEKFDDAALCYKTAIELMPDYIDAIKRLINLYKKLEKKEDLLFWQKKLLEQNRENALINHEIGETLFDLGDFKEAINYYQACSKINPKNANALNNIGNCYYILEKFEEALNYYKISLELLPDNPVCNNNIGNALQKLGRFDEAVFHYKKALKLNPEYSEAYNNIGNIFQNKGKLNQALYYYQKALDLKSDNPEVLSNMGVAFLEQGKLQKAFSYFQSSVKIKPDFVKAYNNMGNTLKDEGKIDESIYFYKIALKIKPDYFEAHSNLLFAMQHMDKAKNTDIFMESQNWNKKYADTVPKYKHTKLEEFHTPIKIGYISPDFKQHSVSFFFLPILLGHNKNEFEIYCYSDTKKNDHVTEKIKSLCHHFKIILGMSDDSVSNIIYQDKIDILVDIAGHTANNRLLVFARKPSPIQVTWLGYPDTTGLTSIDYRLTDNICDPVGDSDQFHSERLIRLEDGFLCYMPIDDAPDVSMPPFMNNNFITFGSFNNLPKITQTTISVWSSILNRLPNSILILKSRQFEDELIKNRYLNFFSNYGIDPKRIFLMPRSKNIKEHLAYYNKIDIGLDTFPYNGTTTTFEALWMGVPVITLKGNRHAARVGASILSRINLCELISKTQEEYIDKAVNLATNKKKLVDLKKSIRSIIRNSPLYKQESFAKKIENTYKFFMVERHNFNSESLFKLSESIYKSGNNVFAILLLNKAIKKNPNIPEYYFCLGNIFKKQSNFEAAILAYKKAIQTKSDFKEAYNNMGNAFYSTNRLSDAMSCYKQALSIDSNFEDAWNNLGITYVEIGEIDKAYECFNNALSIKPDYAKAHFNLVFSMNYDASITQKQIYEKSVSWWKIYEPLFPKFSHHEKDLKKNKLRIGYISPDFRDHSVSHFFLPLIKAHNKSKFEIFCYADVFQIDKMTENIKKYADEWKDITSKTDDEVALEIYNDKIDILVDLAGCTANNRLLVFARKPAPVTVTWLGYPNTVGMKSMDFRITDEIADPLGESDIYHAETLLRLPNGFLCYKPQDNAPDVSPIISSEKIVFGSFNNISKINETLIRVWSEILKRNHSSCLLLKSKQLSDKFICNKFYALFKKYGIFPERIEMMGKIPDNSKHLNLYNKIHIALDTFPYNGTTTTFDALYMGVPVITLVGNHHASRVGASILKRINLEKFIASNEEDYIVKAVNLSYDIKKLGIIKQNLRDILLKSPLCEPFAFAESMENLYNDITKPKN
ncbi:MAG: tetratricopeptide repeat protein [Desulfobacterales bacterium]|nr:tetratricopeptide repeat protein [Desulfobacterales bacterium]